MGWGNEPPKRQTGSSGWGNVRVKPVITMEMVTEELRKAGAQLTDAEGGDWSVEYQGQTGFLFTRCSLPPRVYTDAKSESLLCGLLRQIGVDYRKAPTGGWDDD